MRTFTLQLVTIICLVALAACGTTKPSRYYLLTPVEASGSDTAGLQSQTIGIGPVSLPAYLNRPEIVMRIDDNQLQYAEFDRWAEPLTATFTRALLENLSSMLPESRTLAYPWSRSTTVNYQVEIDVTRFDSDAAGTIVLAAGWELLRSSDNTVLEHGKATYTEAAGSTDYPDIVAAQSRALARLSRDIATALDALAS